MKTIHRSVAKDGQSVTLTEICQFKEAKLRIRVKSDAYEAQSFARIELWSENRWSEIYTLHGSEMKTPSKLVYYKPATTPVEAWANDFNGDTNLLKSLAEKILG